MDLIAKLSGQDNLTPTLKKIKKELTDTGNAASKLDQIQARFEKIQTSSAPLKKRLADLKKLMAEMNLDGLSNTDVFTRMAMQAGQYADALGDASTAVKQFSNDTMGLKAATQGLQLVTGAATALTGAMNLFGVENEKVNEAILKVQASLAILNGVQAIANVLNKDSALSLALQKAAQIGATVTTTTFTAALSKQAIVEALVTAKQKIATAAQTAWNVAKAIGMAMLGNYTGLCLLAAAGIATVAIAMSKSTDEEKKNTDAMKANVDAQDLISRKNQEVKESVEDSVAKVVAQYRLMQTEWKALTTEQEKTEWIKANQQNFNQLGVDISDVNAAEEFMVKQSDKVIAALKAKAKAAAYYSVYQEALENQIKANASQHAHFKKNSNGKWVMDYGDMPIEGEYENATEIKQSWANQVKAKQAAANAAVAMYEKEFLEANQKSNEADSAISSFKSSGGKPKGGGSGKAKGGKSSQKEKELSIKDDNGSVDFMEKYISQLRNKLKTIPVEKTELIDTTKKALMTCEKELNSRKLLIQPEIAFPEGSIEYAEAMISDINEKIQTIDLSLLSEEELSALMDEKKKWENELKNRKITAGLETAEIPDSVASISKSEGNKQFKKGDIDDLRQSLSNAKAIIEQIKSDYANGFIDTSTAKSQIDELNQKLQELGLKPIELTIKTDGIEEVKSAAELAREATEELNSNLQSLQGNVGQMIDSFVNLAQIMGNGQATAAQQAGAALATMGAAMEQIAGDGLAAKVGATMAAIGQIILGFAAASAQAAQLGPWGWLAYVGAGLATVATVISQIKSYNGGGIVEGARFAGDTVMANLNSGEMVLNRKQQSNLFNLLDNGGGRANGKGKVEFKISGDSLKGVLRNYDKKFGKL